MKYFNQNPFRSVLVDAVASTFGLKLPLMRSLSALAGHPVRQPCPGARDPAANGHTAVPALAWIKAAGNERLCVPQLHTHTLRAFRGR